MADPRPLTRKELARFLPDQRSIRAFERLFDLIPDELVTLLQAIDESNNNANSALNLAQQALKRNSVLLDYIDLRVNPPHPERSRILTWSGTDDTLNIHHSDGVIQQVGQEFYVRFTNDTYGADIPNGTVVGLEQVGGVSTNDIVPYLADGNTPEVNVIGVTTQDVPDGAQGRAVTFGIVNEIDTTGTPYGESWAEGDTLYASPRS